MVAVADEKETEGGEREVKREYRIVTDEYSGFEAQFRPWWSPFWLAVDFSNTSSTIEWAEDRIRRHQSRTGRSTVVKYLGWFPEK